MLIETVNQLDPDFHELAEQEFIINKKRAGALLEHFPFLKDNKKFKNIIIKDDAGKVVGGLIIKIIQDKSYLVGCIGLVVVAREARGQGYSKLLLRKAIEDSQKDDMDYLLLWTSLHEFYAQFGFEIDEPLTYLEINEQHELKGISKEVIVDFESQPTYTQAQGRLNCGDASVNFLQDGSGYIFVSYNGDAATAAAIVSHQFGSASKPRVVIPSNDPLINELKKIQPDIIQYDHNYEMCLKLKDNVHSKKVFDFSQRI